MNHGDKDILIPMPMMSYRDPLPNKNTQKTSNQNQTKLLEISKNSNLSQQQQKNVSITSKYGSQSLNDYVTNRQLQLSSIGIPIKPMKSFVSEDTKNPKKQFGTVENAIGMKSRTLRKQFHNADGINHTNMRRAAPFATDY